MSLLSIILPCYNEQASIQYAYDCIGEAMDSTDIQYELIYIDDGSSDGTFTHIQKLAYASKKVRGLRFSRNFGKEAAIFAGMAQARGDCCVVMDCDMQHPPQTIPKMYQLWTQGYYVVEGVKRRHVGEPLFFKASSRLFHSMISRLSGFDLRDSSDFKLLDRKVIDTLLSLQERNVFFRGLSFWVGYRSVRVEYDVQPRRFDKTKWPVGKLFSYALDNITSFSALPMQLIAGMGAVLLLLSLVLGIQTLVKFLSGQALEGFPTVIMLLLIIGGCLMLSLGIIGKYLAKIYDEVKARPRFIISEETESSP